jgi:putative membrane protein
MFRLRAAVPAGSVAVVLSATALFAAAPAVADSPSVRDTSYARSAAAANLAEIQMAKIALQRTKSSSVRQVATTISTDHKTAEMQLAQVASSSGITLPGKPNPQQLQQIGELQSVPAGSFDVTYLQMQVGDHEAAMHGVAAVEATAPATNERPAPSNVVSSGPEAFGAKSSGSDDTGWLIGLAVVAALAIAAVLLWFRHTAGSNERV